MQSFLRQQRPLLLAAAAIAAWLVVLPSALRIAGFAGINTAVPLESGRELVSVFKIDEASTYDCALALQPRGSVLDELEHLYAKFAARHQPQPSDILSFEFHCSAYRIDLPEKVRSAHSQGAIDFDLSPSIHLSRVQVERFFGFELEPGIYVVKGVLKAKPEVLSRLNLAAHLELPRRPPDGKRRVNASGLHKTAAASPLLLMLLAGLCGVLLWRSIVAVLSPRFAPPDGAAGPSTLGAFRALPSGKKKVVLSLPVAIISLAAFYLPSLQAIKSASGMAFIVSLAVLLVGLVEARWSTRIARWSERFAALHPAVRALVATGVLIVTLYAGMFVVWAVSNLVATFPSLLPSAPPPAAQTAPPAPAPAPPEPSPPSMRDSPYYRSPELTIPDEARFHTAEIPGKGESDALLSTSQLDQVNQILAGHKCAFDNLLVYFQPGKPEKLVMSTCYRANEPADQHQEAALEIEYPVLVSVAADTVREVDSLSEAGFGFLYRSGSLKAVTDLNDNGRLELWLEGAICECDGNAKEPATEPCDCIGTSVAEIFDGKLRVYQP